MRLSLVLVVASSILLAPVAGASTKVVKPAPVDYSDVTGPKIDSIKVNTTILNLSKKAAVVKIIITVSDDLNSVNDASAYFSRLDTDGKITGPKLMITKPKPSKRVSSKIIDGRRVEVFEMTSTFPKGLAAGQYKMLTGDFRDLASNRRQDLSSVNQSADLLPIITVS